LWLHGSSAGELMQARPLLLELRRRLPERPLVYTYGSPSAEPFLDRLGPVDLALPLPLDGRAEMRSLFDALRPAALALVDAELWPGLLLEAERRDVPAALVAGRLGPGSRRLAAAARPLHRALLRTLRLVGAVDERSADAFREAGAARACVAVTGDPRVDEVLADAGPPDAPLRRAGLDLPLLVAGSTWAEDEAVLLDACARLRRDGPAFALVLAPHGTDEPRLRDVERRLDGAGLRHRRWSGGDGGSARRTGRPDDPASLVRDSLAEAPGRVLLVDRVGVLRALYSSAAAAWVGGGFRGALHNVMEPAARGAAVVTGPRTGRAWIAEPLERAGGLFRVRSAGEAAGLLERLLGDGEWAARAGARGRAVLEERAGATTATIAALATAGWLPQPATGAVPAR
jgi:3-deoxy-D-manno-octulosonic-acid transferase